MKCSTPACKNEATWKDGLAAWCDWHQGQHSCFVNGVWRRHLGPESLTPYGCKTRIKGNP